MTLFRVVPRIVLYDEFAEFAAAFQIGEDDLIITTEPLYRSGIENLNLQCKVLFSELYGSGEPSDAMMDAILAETRRRDFKRLIAVGGGAVIDVAKLAALRGPGKTRDYFDGRQPVRKEKELIIIPTTCGTGSEMTNISILEIKDQKTKKGLASDELFADYAVLIPGLLTSLPYRVFATSSMDALIHAAESFVAPASNVLTELYSVKAISLIISGYRQIIQSGQDRRIPLAKDFLLASSYAGIAFGNTGVGAVHAMSYPLGGAFHVPHGEANQQMFTAVFQEYKKVKPEGKIQLLEQQLADLLHSSAATVWAALDDLLEGILPLKPLKEYGMKLADIEPFADSVLQNQQRLLKNNYTPLSREALMGIYKSRY